MDPAGPAPITATSNRSTSQSYNARPRGCARVAKGNGLNARKSGRFAAIMTFRRSPTGERHRPRPAKPGAAAKSLESHSYNPPSPGVCPSGQRERAVNPSAQPTEVRILPPPLRWEIRSAGKSGRVAAMIISHIDRSVDVLRAIGAAAADLVVEHYRALGRAVRAEPRSTRSHAPRAQFIAFELSRGVGACRSHIVSANSSVSGSSRCSARASESSSRRR